MQAAKTGKAFQTVVHVANYKNNKRKIRRKKNKKEKGGGGRETNEKITMKKNACTEMSVNHEADTYRDIYIYLQMVRIEI